VTAAAEAASVPATTSSAVVKTAGVSTTTADDNQQVEKLRTKLASSLTTKGKFNDWILKIDYQHYFVKVVVIIFSTDTVNP